MRTRITGNKHGPFYPLKAEFSNAGHGSASCNPFPTAYVGSESKMEDYNNSSTYKSKGIVMSPCRLTRRERIAEENPIRTVEAANINGSLAKATFSGDFAGYFAYGLPNQLEADMDRAKNIALIEAYAKMNESGTLAGEQIATMRQTIGMIRSPFSSLTKLAIRYRKRLKQTKASIRRTYIRDRKRLVRIKAKPLKFTELANAFALEMERAVANCWLELRYGMTPLMIDAEKHIDYIRQKLADEQSNSVLRVARSGSKTIEKNSSWSGSPWCGLEYVHETHASANWSLAARASAGVLYSVSPRSNIEDLSAHLGLRVSDIPSTAWELIPLSFVADWAINVGDWLRAITPVPGIQPRANWVTVVERRETTISDVSFHTYLGWFTNHYVQVNFPSGTEKVLSYVREVDNSLATHPMLLGKPLSNLHLGDAAALSVQKFVTAIRKLF